MDQPNGSTMRVKWEYEALCRQGFSKISILDNFGKNSQKPSNSLFHAQQHSGKFLEKKSYISDLHGIAFEEMWHKSFQFPFHSWKRWGFRTKSHYIDKLEKNIWKNSLHLVCASDFIYDKVKHIQNCTVIRNSVKIDDYYPSTCTNLQIAVVGPFLPGTQNYDALDLIQYCVKKLNDVDFILIGSASDDFKQQLNFSNVTFLGRVDNYIEELTKCSVLLSPYPEHSHILASKNKMLESGACEMAVITSESGALGFPDDFFLVGKSKQDFVDHIISLRDENLRKNYAKKLKDEIKKNYNADNEVKKLIKLYKEFTN
jgi:glycosyltransferase involved in cell wall biosynthesis